MALDGMTALVTEASWGMDLAIATTLGLKGATVYLSARNLEPLQIPMGRPGKAEEVAAAPAFPASREAGTITGQVLPINGGLYM